MNFLEIILTFGYVMFATGLISLGCYLHGRAERRNEVELKSRHLEVVMANLKDTVE